MRYRLALLACMVVAGCGDHDSEVLQQQKTMLELMKSQNKQLAASMKSQKEKLVGAKQTEDELRVLKKRHQVAMREIESLRERIRQYEADASEKADSQNRQNEVDAVLAEARILYTKGDLDKAFVTLSKGLRHIGPNHDLLTARGCVLLGHPKGYDAAIDDLTEAIQLDSQDAHTLYLRGIAYATAGKSARAIKDLDAAMKLDPKLAPTCCLFKGQQYLRQQDYSKAIAELTEAARLDPLNEEVFYHRGSAYARLADVDIYRVRNITKFDEQAVAFWSSEYCRKAASDFREAIRLYPDHTKAQAALTELKRLAGGKSIPTEKEWAAVEKKAMEQNFAEENAVAELEAAKDRSLDSTIAELTEAIRLHPTKPDLYFQRASYHWMNGMRIKAIADITEAIRLKPECASYYYQRARAYKLLGELGKAEKDFAKAKKLGYRPGE